MLRRCRRFRASVRLLSALLVVFTVMGIPALRLPAFADNLYASHSAGFDFSFPQCGSLNVPDQVTVNAPYQFAIIGVNHGRAYTPNTCLANQISYAASKGLTMAFVINLNAPRVGQATGSNASNTANSGCAADDLACSSYVYGWNAAQDAFNVTEQALLSVGDRSIPTGWWMDIESANYWSPNTALNDRVIQGAIDFVQQTIPNGVMGVYSTQSEWNAIAGSNYQPGVPAWLAGARSFAGAPSLCGLPSFTGGPVAIVQYATRLLDVDYAC